MSEADFGCAAGAVIQSYPPFGGYQGGEFAVKIAGGVFAQTTAPVADLTQIFRVLVLLELICPLTLTESR